jgi:hypothetical protein
MCLSFDFHLTEDVLLSGSGISKNGYDPSTEVVDLLGNTRAFTTAFNTLVDSPISTVDQAGFPIICGRNLLNG